MIDVWMQKNLFMEKNIWRRSFVLCASFKVWCGQLLLLRFNSGFLCLAVLATSYCWFLIDPWLICSSPLERVRSYVRSGPFQSFLIHPAPHSSIFEWIYLLSALVPEILTNYSSVHSGRESSSLLFNLSIRLGSSFFPTIFCVCLYVCPSYFCYRLYFWITRRWQQQQQQQQQQRRNELISLLSLWHQ